MASRRQLMKMVGALKRLVGIGICAAFVSIPAWSQTYPNRSVELVSAFGPGTGVDFAARVVAQKLSETMGQPFVVVNKPGAAGTLATTFVSDAPADGYTLLVNSAALTLYPSLYPDVPFNAETSFASVASLVETELVLVTASSKGWRTLEDLIAYAKSNPRDLTFGSSGVGSTTQMSFERLAHAAGFDALHIPFKGTADAVTDVVAGRVDTMYGVISSAMGHIDSGRLVPLAVAGKGRSMVLPDVPTSIEAGIPESDYSTWTAVFAPSGTPEPILEALHTAIDSALSSPDVVEKLKGAGLVPIPQSREQFQNQLQADFASNAVLAKVVRDKAQ